MSYCRWSCDNYGCDLYIYQTKYHYVIHVASRRVIGDVPIVDYTKNIHEVMRQYNKQNDFMETCKYEYINLPYDGETFELDKENAIDMLKTLQKVGYRCDYDSVISAIKNDE